LVFIKPISALAGFFEMRMIPMGVTSNSSLYQLVPSYWTMPRTAQESVSQTMTTLGAMPTEGGLFMATQWTVPRLRTAVIGLAKQIVFLNAQNDSLAQRVSVLESRLLAPGESQEASALQPKPLSVSA
jgi:hypothetical protein